MTEEQTTTDAAGNAGKKKPAAKRAPSKAKTTASKAAAAKRPTARKATAPQKAAKKAVQADASKSDQPANNETSHAGQQDRVSEPRPEQPEQPEGGEQRHNTANLVEDLKGRDWPKIIQRALLMVFFGFLAWVTISVAFFLATAQVVISIFVGEPNAALTRLIKQGANYIHDVLDYLSFASDECPFPFGRKLPDPD